MNKLFLLVLFSGGLFAQDSDLELTNLHRSVDYQDLDKKLRAKDMFYSLSVLNDDPKQVERLESLKTYLFQKIELAQIDEKKCSNTQSHMQESCMIELARHYFSQKKYNEAEAIYETVSNRSLLWPSVLLERAWNNYKIGNYNRTLGLLSTYKFPFLRPYYSLEVSYLEALSYHRLCMWGDALFAIEEAKKQEFTRVDEMTKFIKGLKKNEKLMVSGSVDAQKTWPGLLQDWVSSMLRENYWRKRQIEMGQIKLEIAHLADSQESVYRDIVIKKLKKIDEKKQIELGLYFNQRLKDKLIHAQFMMEKMEVLELEVLSASRKVFYANKVEVQSRKIGDAEYLPTKKFQYFWDFKEEFWSDELGFYVFALKTQC